MRFHFSLKVRLAWKCKTYNSVSALHIHQRECWSVMRGKNDVIISVWSHIWPQVSLCVHQSFPPEPLTEHLYVFSRRVRPLCQSPTWCLPSCSSGPSKHKGRKSAATQHRWDLHRLRCTPTVMRFFPLNCSHASDLTCSFTVCMDGATQNRLSVSPSSLETLLHDCRVCGRKERRLFWPCKSEE